MYNRKFNTGNWGSGSSNNRNDNNDDYGGQDQQSADGHDTSSSSGRYNRLSNESGGFYGGRQSQRGNGGTNMASKDTYGQKGGFNQEKDLYSIDCQKETGNSYKPFQRRKGGMGEQKSLDQYDNYKNSFSSFLEKGGGGGGGVGGVGGVEDTSNYYQRRGKNFHQVGGSSFDTQRLGKAPYMGLGGGSSFDTQRLGNVPYKSQAGGSSFDTQRLGNIPYQGGGSSFDTQRLGNAPYQSQSGGSSFDRQRLGIIPSRDEEKDGMSSMLSRVLGGSPSLLGETKGYQGQSESKPGMEEAVVDILKQVLDIQDEKPAPTVPRRRSRFDDPSGSLMLAAKQNIQDEKPAPNIQGRRRSRFDNPGGSFGNKWTGSFPYQQQPQHPWSDSNRYALSSEPKDTDFDSMRRPRNHHQRDVALDGHLHKFTPYPTQRPNKPYQKPEKKIEAIPLMSMELEAPEGCDWAETLASTEPRSSSKAKKLKAKSVTPAAPVDVPVPKTDESKKIIPMLIKKVTDDYAQKCVQKFEGIPHKALHCNVCKPYKYNGVHTSVTAYLAHQNKGKHMSARLMYNSRVNQLIKFLMADAQLGYVRKFGPWEKDEGEKDEKEKDEGEKDEGEEDAGEDLCDICKVPKSHEGEDHLVVYECWINHEYNQPTCVCGPEKFENRILYEDHCLTLDHLQGEQETRAKMIMEYRAGRDEMKIMKKEFRNGMELEYEPFNNFILDRSVALYERFGGQCPVPQNISWIFQAFEKMQVKAPQRQAVSNPHDEFKFQHYNPSIPMGPEPIVFQSEFECSLCKVALGITKEKVVEHCASEQHYDNINDKERLDAWRSETEKSGQPAIIKRRFIRKGRTDPNKSNASTKGDDEEEEDEDDEDEEMDE